MSLKKRLDQTKDQELCALEVRQKLWTSVQEPWIFVWKFENVIQALEAPLAPHHLFKAWNTVLAFEHLFST